MARRCPAAAAAESDAHKIDSVIIKKGTLCSCGGLKRERSLMELIVKREAVFF